jgi:hypothetical protein
MRIALWALFAFAAAGCPTCTGVHVCDPACEAGYQCDLSTAECIRNLCTTAEDCGSPHIYSCEPIQGSTFKHCVGNSCIADADCDDGRFCNGRERCLPSEGGADIHGCVQLPAPCQAGQTCDEANAVCVTTCAVARDADGDGHDTLQCGGDDCDDNDPHRFPGNPEVCDAQGHDEDCDPTTFGTRDSDGDGYVDMFCCNTDGTTRHCGTDCDDNRSDVHPGVPEVCDGIDNNCDTGIDDQGLMMTAYPDDDHDGYGRADGGSVTLCPQNLGDRYSPYANDCDDTNPAITPGSVICDNPQFPANVLICSSDGVWVGSKCMGSGLCVVQPDGLGVCE